MTLPKTLQLLFEKGIISKDELERGQHRPISLYWEINTLLLVGVSCLSAGVGILVYKNIDTIGHLAIIGVIALLTVVCGGYAYQKRQPFLMKNRQKEQPLADTMLLLACSLFLILEGYLQYQYQVFGTRYGLATLIPAIIFFFCAYRFDHIGVLTMAMTGFVSWLGLSVTPLSIFTEDVFQYNPTLIHTGIAAGAILILIGFILHYRQIKPHFTFSYMNFGFNLAFIACLYGAFNIDRAPYSSVCLIFSILAILYARYAQSYFFLFIGVIYGYIAFTTLLTIPAFEFDLWLLYGVISCLGVLIFFLNYKKFLE